MLVAAPGIAVNPPRLRFGRRGATALLAVLLLTLAAALAARSGGAAAPATAAPPGYGELPVAFVANAGQSDARVRYLAQGGGYGFFFTDHGVRLALSASGAGERAVALELGFVGANRHARPVASDRAAGTVNYLGAGRGAAQAGLATFGAVTYPELWPGIDMVFRGDGGRLKYEFHVAPGADPRAISLAYSGAEGLALTGGGALAIKTGAGTLTDARPVSYQGAGTNVVPVESHYRLQGAGYGFTLPAGYDRSRPLVIDPGLAYSTFIGGSSTDEGGGIAVDAQRSAYVAALTSSPGYPTSLGAFSTTHSASYDVAVTKLTPDGSGIVYSTFIGGAGPDIPQGIAVDAEGSAYVTGITESPGYPTTAGAQDTSYNGNEDAFVTKLTPDGTALAYSTFLGGPNPDAGLAISLDSQRGAYLTGRTESPGFPATAGAYDATYNSPGRNAFVTKLSASGTVAYSTFLGGASDTVGVGIATDQFGGAFVTGQTASGFPTSAGAFQTTSSGGGYDAFVTKFLPSGAGLAYSTYLGGSAGHDEGRAIAVDRAGAAYVTGQTQSPNYPVTPGALDASHNGLGDAFVTKLEPSGGALAYSTFLGGADWDLGSAIAVDRPGSAAHITGYTHSAGFPTTTGAFDSTHNGGYDAYVTKLGPSGALIDSTFLGGASDDMGNGIAIDSQADAYVTGFANSPGYPTTPGAYDTTHNNNKDVFVTKLGPAPPTPAPGGFIQLPGAAGCISSVPAAPCTPGRELSGARAVLVSPDGKHVYASGAGLTSFDRDPQTGELTQKSGPAGCFTRGTATVPNCVSQFPAAANLTGLAMTPDGRHVYVADFADDEVTVFDRDPATGVLTPKAATTTAPAMDGPNKLSVSPDGRNLYVAGFAGNSVTAFVIDAAGGLTPVAGGGCVVNGPPVSGCASGRALRGATDVTVDPAGTTVYVSTDPSVAGESSISALTRDPATGGLTPVAGPAGCVTASALAGCTVSTDLAGVADITIGSGNGPLYAAIPGTGRVLAFDRQPAGGGLVLRPGSAGCVSSGAVAGCMTGRGFGGARGLASTNDGADVYVVGEGIAELDRAAGGSLTQGPGLNACWVFRSVPGCTTAHGIFSGMQDVAGSPDDRFFYVPGTDGEISIYRRDMAVPVCAHVKVKVVTGTTTKLPVPCTDADGDDIQLKLIDPPTLGSAGPIDNVNRSITYTAPPSEIGSTTITFDAAYPNGTFRSDPGSITVEVVAGLTTGGTVPATLALTLGPAASFGAFTPGVAKDYDTSTVASVTSTAGDAELTVSDPSPVATGHLVNEAFSLPAALLARASSAAGTGKPFADVGGSATPTSLLSYAAPVSNDAATLSFRQRIGAGDALRSGAYAKVLTFTLSTTSP